MKCLLALVFGAVVTVAFPVAAQEPTADLLRAHLYEGTLEEGLAAMEVLSGEGDTEAAFGAGLLRFLVGAQTFAQAMFAHGFDPERGIVVSPFMGAFAAPEAPSREIAPLDYDQLRGYLEGFSGQMDAAREGLVAASADTGYAVEIDLMRIRFDLDGDGVGDDQGTVAAILGQASAMGGELDMPEQAVVSETVFAFDAADAIWLAGYSQVLAAQTDFLLAHDFETTFTAVMHRVFPGAGLPMEGTGHGELIVIDPETDMLAADMVAGIHTLNWPVVDRDRFVGVQDRLFDIIALSRRNWDAIIAESDDHLEFIPAPRQTPVFDEMKIDKAMVSAWLATLDTLETIVSGDLLLPHWRFPRMGFDLNAYFAEAERTDAVMILSGYGALPFMREGKIAGAENFEAANSVFGDAIWGYGAWFN